MATPTYNSTVHQTLNTARAWRVGCRWFRLGFLLLILAASTAAAAPRFVPGQILVQPRAGLSETNFVGKLNRQGALNRRTLHHSNIRIVSVSEDKADATLTALRKDPDIEFAERDFIAEVSFVPNDPYVVSGDEWHLTRIQAESAWDFTAGLSNTVVAVLDSGVNAAQPDLAGRILSGYDFVNGDSDPTDDFGHGTAVAGTIVANGNNGRGVAGVAFGCRVLPVKIVDASGFATYSCVAQGIRYAVDQGARVINLSIAGDASSATLQDAVDYAWSHNVVVVAAAGNNANNVFQYPAACNHVVAVSATAADDSLAWFSSYGSYVTLAAPGVNIWTTQRDANDPYGSWSGTSFATPIVAGAAALVASENPALSNDQIVSLLKQTADDTGVPGYDTSFGFGRVNAFRAVSAASLMPGALPPVGPVPETTNGNPTEIFKDINSPSVAITESPGNNSRLTTPDLFLAGTADDDTGVQEIQVQVNGATQPANGTTNWSAQVALSPGENTIAIRSVDLAGNVSPEVVRTFTYVFSAPLVVQTSGAGTVKPDLNGKLLEVGKVYTMKAAPATGQVFAGWSGAVSTSPVLSFTMQTNLTLVANFVPSPFPAIRGSYAGLTANTNGVTPDSSGYFAMTATASGLFTGKFLLGGKHYGFHGQLDLNGNAFVSVMRGKSSPLTLGLHANLTNGSDQVFGYATDGTWTSGVTGDRNVFNSKLNPARQAGLHAFILERADQPVTAATGSSAISTGGSTKVKGRLDDGRAFGAGSSLARNGDYPFYLSLNRGQEIVIGWLNFPAAGTPTASGTVLWVRSGTNSFAATLQAASAP